MSIFRYPKLNWHLPFLSCCLVFDPPLSCHHSPLSLFQTTYCLGILSKCCFLSWLLSLHSYFSLLISLLLPMTFPPFFPCLANYCWWTFLLFLLNKCVVMYFRYASKETYSYAALAMCSSHFLTGTRWAFVYVAYCIHYTNKQHSDF